MQKEPSLIRRTADGIRKRNTAYAAVWHVCALSNIRRIRLAAAIAVPLESLLLILLAIARLVGRFPAGWTLGTLWYHTGLLAVMTLFLFASCRMRGRRRYGPGVESLTVLFAVTMQLTGIALSILARESDDGVIAYLLTSIITGIVLLIRPFSALAMHLLTYIAFAAATALGGAGYSPVLSCQLNGLFGAGIGAFLSILMWNYHYVNLRQKERIEVQRRELERKNRELEQMAFFDWLTGLPNRRFFDRHVIENASGGPASGSDDCLILIDIDHFKRINDTFGHPAGDEVLRKVAYQLAAGLRRTDLISRLGGEEFLLLLHETPVETGILVAEKLRKSIADMRVRVDRQEIRLTASFGVSPLHRQPGGIGKNYYAAADEALYRAKENGRNRVEFHEAV